MSKTSDPDLDRRDLVTNRSIYTAWNIIAFLMLSGACLFMLADQGLAAWQKALALGLALLWGAWYWTFIVHPNWWRDWLALRIILFAASALLAFGLTWLHPAFLMLMFTYYGTSFGFLPMRWAIPQVILVTILLSIRFIGFNGGLSIQSLPIIASFGLSGLFAILLGLYIDSIIKQNRARQEMINQLEATRSELASAERQAGMLEERQRLAGEIHDTLAQGFTSVILHLEAAQQSLDSNAPEAHQHVDQALETARENLAEARRFLWALRPQVLEHEPLAGALQRVAGRFSQENDLPVNVNIAGEARPLAQPVEVTLLRAVQESLANVHKHAGARRVDVTLTYMEGEVILDVQDDGAGFDPAQIEQLLPNGGFGLAAMRRRVEGLGGSLSIESSPGEGATLVIQVPVQ